MNKPTRPPYFYYQTVKNIITAFGVIFRDVYYYTDFGEPIKVPIHYSPREKFIEIVQVGADHDDGYETWVNLPRFGFEMSSISYDSIRASNPLSKIHDLDDDLNKYMFNRVPYNLSFTLYLAVRKMEDGLKIIEQIVPFFTPELNVTIKDKEDFNITTDIPFVLNGISSDIEYQGEYTERRTITWTLDFTAKAWLYSNIRERKRIKETIVEMTDRDFNTVYETLISYVDPRSANKDDPHIIVDKIYMGKAPIHLTFDFYNGDLLNAFEYSDNIPYTILDLMPIKGINQNMKLVEFLNDYKYSY